MKPCNHLFAHVLESVAQQNQIYVLQNTLVLLPVWFWLFSCFSCWASWNTALTQVENSSLEKFLPWPPWLSSGFLTSLTIFPFSFVRYFPSLSLVDVVLPMVLSVALLSFQDSPSSVFIFYHVLLRLYVIVQLVESYFPEQGLNSGPYQCKCSVLTTGPPGNALHTAFKQLFLITYLKCLLLS